MILPRGTAQTHSFLLQDTTGQGITGRIVTAAVSKDGGAYYATTNAVEEVAGGAYKVLLTAAERDAEEVVIRYDDGVVGGLLYVYPDTEDIAAIKAKTDTIGALEVTITSPVADDGTVSIVQGDSYSAARSRPIDILVADPTHAKALDAADTTVYLLASQFTWEADSVTETVAGYTVRFEPTIAQTAAVTTTRQSGKLKACIDNVAPADDEAETIQNLTILTTRDIPPVP